MAVWRKELPLDRGQWRAVAVTVAGCAVRDCSRPNAHQSSQTPTTPVAASQTRLLAELSG